MSLGRVAERQAMTIAWRQSNMREDVNWADVPSKLIDPLYKTNADWFTTDAQPDSYGSERNPLTDAAPRSLNDARRLLANCVLFHKDGTPPKRVTVQQWDSLEVLKAWYNGKDYQEALQIGRKYATFRSYAVEGLSR